MAGDLTQGRSLVISLLPGNPSPSPGSQIQYDLSYQETPLVSKFNVQALKSLEA